MYDFFFNLVANMKKPDIFNIMAIIKICFHLGISIFFYIDLYFFAEATKWSCFFKQVVKLILLFWFLKSKKQNLGNIVFSIYLLF